MKIIDFLDLLVDYQRVTVTPGSEMEWNGDNPYIINPVKVRELTWHFVREVGNREVVEVRSSIDSDDTGDNSYIAIEYK